MGSSGGDGAKFLFLADLENHLVINQTKNKDMRTWINVKGCNGICSSICCCWNLDMVLSYVIALVHICVFVFD